MKKRCFLTILILLFITGIMLSACESKKGDTDIETEKTVESDPAESVSASEDGVYTFSSDDPKVLHAQESDNPIVVISDVEASPGEQVEIPLILVNNPGILGMSMTLSYDDSVLTLVEATNGDAVNEILDMSHTPKLGNGSNFLWDGESISDSEIRDGVILTLLFEVAEDATNAKTPIVMLWDKGGSVNNKLEEVELIADNGYIVVNK